MEQVALNTEVSPSTLRYQPRCVSGFRPIREPHLGHYLGSVRQTVEQQNRHPWETYCFIADLHAAPSWTGRQNLEASTIRTAAALLSLGVDPRKSFVFLQSSVKGLSDIAWLLACMTPANLILHSPVLAASADRKLNMGALFYGVLMAADVLSLRGTKLLVGRDQVINVRQVRQIAKAANRYLSTELFPVPDWVQSPTVPGTDGTKMDQIRDNHLPIFAGFRELDRRIKNIQTDSRGIHDPKDPQTCRIFQLFSTIASADQIDEMRERYVNGSIGYDEAKRRLAIAITEHFAGAMDQFEDWKQRPDDIRDVLRQGARLASDQACQVLALLRHKLGFKS